MCLCSKQKPTNPRRRAPEKKKRSTTMAKNDVNNVVLGLPYSHGHQGGAIPPNASFGDPKAMGVPIQQTIYRDTPATFNCVYCGDTGLTTVRSKVSFGSICRLHYCPSCNEKVADFKKSDPCLVMDPPQWAQESFALSG